MKTLEIQVEQQKFEELQAGKVPEFYLPPTKGNAVMLANFDKKGTYLGIKKYDQIVFKRGFAVDAPKITFKIKLIEYDLFENFIPEGMQKGDKAFTIELGPVIVQ